jgi:hypothetical protein
MIHTEAEGALDENERAVDVLLGAPDRVQFIQEYADGLREASMVRDVLETRQADVEHSMAQMQGFSFGLAGRVVNMDPARRVQLVRELGLVEQALAFWRRAFPLLTRMRTQDIQATSVEAVLRDIKASIIATRAQVAVAPQGRAGFDLWDLDNIRTRVDATLGPRATAAVHDEETSRRRWAVAKTGGTLAASIALLFIPGGAFIDVAVGVAMGAQAIDRAQDLGQAAKSGMHVDDALVSQAAAGSAEFEAVVATIFAVVGVAAAGLRVLRVGRMFLRVRHAAPEMSVAGQLQVARRLAENPALRRAGSDLGEVNSAIAAMNLQHVVRGGAGQRGVGVLYIESRGLSADELRDTVAHFRDADFQAGMAGGYVRQRVPRGGTLRRTGNRAAAVSRDLLDITDTNIVGGHTPDMAGGGSALGPIMALPRQVNSAIAGQWGRYEAGFVFEGYSLWDRTTRSWLYVSQALEHPPAAPVGLP